MYYIDYEKIRELQKLSVGELRFIFGLLSDFNGFINSGEITNVNRDVVRDLLYKEILVNVQKEILENCFNGKLLYRISSHLIGYIELDGHGYTKESITVFPDKLTDLTLNEYRLLFKMLYHLDEWNIVKVNKQRKERFANELNISVNTLKKALMTLKQKGIMDSNVYNSYCIDYFTFRTSISICLRESDFKKELST